MDHDAFELYRAGLKLHRAKDLAGAVRLLEQATRSDAGLADAWEALGVLYDKLGRLDDAIEATRKWAQLKPDDVMAHTNLSRFYMKKGWKEQAEEEQGKARLLGWKQELAGGGAGDSALQQSAPAAAEPAAPTLVSLVGAPGAAPLAGGSPPPPYDKVAAAARRIAQFEALVAHDANDVLSRLSLGRAYLDAGRHEEAIARLDEVIAARPDLTAAYVPLGLACERAGKLARALKTWKRGIEVANERGDLHPRNEMQEHLARLQSAPGS